MMRRHPRSVLLPLAACGLVALAAVPAASGLVMPAPPPPRWDGRVTGTRISLEGGPPPISGGTLLVLEGGERAVVSDPDRDRVQVVDLRPDADDPILGSVDLPDRAEPGRAAQDASGRVHLVLRGRGELLSFAPDEPARAERREVCPMPRGVAAQGDSVHVACKGGELVTLPGGGGAPSRTLHLEHDLRDVVVAGQRLHVTRFRDAELIAVDAQGRASVARRPRRADDGNEQLANHVAWRARAIGDRVVMLHQRARENEIQVAGIGGYGGTFGSCQSVVKTALTVFDGQGTPALGPALARAPLPVDFALRTDGERVTQLAVVAAGNQAPASGGVLVLSPSVLSATGCQTQTRAAFASPQVRNPVAVAYASGGRLVVQQRDPAALLVEIPGTSNAHRIELGGDRVFDTGHAIFHASTGANIACASCHPEGGDDGHTWHFDVGPRRTPALHSVAGTAPFHWSGELATMRELMVEVFGRRMSGSGVGQPQVDAVEAWLGHLPRPRSSAPRSPAAARGRALFEGEAGCASCHSGPRLSDGGSANVGTGGTFQTPSLLGVSDRLPVMHDGCATTLERRFVPSCGGERHGPHLSPAQIDDLVAYLETL